MTRAQLLLALSSIAGTAAVLPASDCDCPKSGKRASCTSTQDDSGLLDAVDNVAGRIDADARECFTKIGQLQSKMQKPKCGCDAQPTGCDCCSCKSSGNSSFSESKIAFPERQPGQPIAPQGNVPPSLKVPPPVPDSKIDPFLDEPTRSGQNRVRGRTIQYRSNSNSNNPSASQANPSSGAAPRARYGQQYNPQAQQTPSTADYWAERVQQQRALELVAPASSESQTLDEVFRPAYRLMLRDTDEQPTQAQTSRSNSLRPVPSRNSELPGSEERENSIQYGREIKQTPVYDNPLRR